MRQLEDTPCIFERAPQNFKDPKEIKFEARKVHGNNSFASHTYHNLGLVLCLLIDLLQKLDQLLLCDLGADLATLGHADQKIFDGASLIGLDDGDAGH